MGIGVYGTGIEHIKQRPITHGACYTAYISHGGGTRIDGLVGDDGGRYVARIGTILYITLIGTHDTAGGGCT